VATVRGSGGSSTPYYVVTDHLGSAEKTVSASGTIVELSDYYPFGSVRLNSGTLDDRKGYLGKDYDADTGLTQAEARYYKGSVGRFISEDPVFWEKSQNLQDPQSLNSYSYAGNNPIVKSDPTGRDYYHYDNGKTEQLAPFNRNTNFYEKYDNAMLQSNASVGETNRGNLMLFGILVKPGGQWDYKRNPEGRGYYFVDGKLITAEEFGNLNFGYTGTAFGVGQDILTDAGGVVQIGTSGKDNKGPTLSNFSGNFDDPRDTRNIRAGVSSYNNANRINNSSNYATATNIAYQSGVPSTQSILRSLSAIVAALASLVSQLSE